VWPSVRPSVCPSSPYTDARPPTITGISPGRPARAQKYTRSAKTNNNPRKIMYLQNYSRFLRGRHNPHYGSIRPYGLLTRKQKGVEKPKLTWTFPNFSVPNFKFGRLASADDRVICGHWSRGPADVFSTFAECTLFTQQDSLDSAYFVTHVNRVVKIKCVGLYSKTARTGTLK